MFNLCMKTLEKAVNTLARMASPEMTAPYDPRILLIVTLVYIGVVLSVPMLEPERLIWMALYPILGSEMLRVGYGRVAMRSLWVLPLILLIGIFNPIIDNEPCRVVGSVTLSRGWVSFIALTLRALLAIQALLALVMSIGFYDVCRALDSLGCPKTLTTQLVMLYRYLGVVMEEALTMHRAREARGFGRRSYPLRMWGTFVGQLLLRSLRRSRRINAAMEARCFSGVYRWGSSLAKPSAASWAWLVAWLAVFAALRFVDFTTIFDNLITRSL